MEQSRNFPTPIIWFRNLKRIRLNQQSFARFCGKPLMDFAQRHFVHSDVLMTDTTAGMHALQTGCQKKRDDFRGQSARSWTGRESLYAFGDISGFFEKLTVSSISRALVAAGIIANDACGQFNRSGV